MSDKFMRYRPIYIFNMCIVHHALYLHIVQCMVYNAHIECTMYIAHCIMYNVHCTLYNVQCTLYNVQGMLVMCIVINCLQICKFSVYVYLAAISLLLLGDV